MTPHPQAFLPESGVQNDSSITSTGYTMPNWDELTAQSSFPGWGDPQEQLQAILVFFVLFFRKCLLDTCPFLGPVSDFC